jgi:hypothetical protein
MKKILFLALFFVLANYSYGQTALYSVSQNCVNTKFYIDHGYIKIEDTWFGEKRTQIANSWELNVEEIKVAKHYEKRTKILRINAKQNCENNDDLVIEVIIGQNNKPQISKGNYIFLQLKPEADIDKLIKELKKAILEQKRIVKL